MLPSNKYEMLFRNRAKGSWLRIGTSSILLKAGVLQAPLLTYHCQYKAVIAIIMLMLNYLATKVSIMIPVGYSRGRRYYAHLPEESSTQKRGKLDKIR